MQLAAAAFGAVDRRQQHRCLAAAQSFADPLEPGDRQAGPAGQPDRIDTPLRQQSLDAIGERRRYRHRLPRGAREEPLGHRLFHYIAARRQPQTPSGQPPGDIGHELAAGTDDKTDQNRSVARSRR